MVHICSSTKREIADEISGVFPAVVMYANESAVILLLPTHLSADSAVQATSYFRWDSYKRGIDVGNLQSLEYFNEVFFLFRRVFLESEMKFDRNLW